MRQRIRVLFINVRYAFALIMHGKSQPFIATVVVHDLSLTLDWTAAEHVPIREVMIRREYAPEPDWLPLRSHTVVDVGANAGVFALEAARMVGSGGRVFAIEPNPDPFHRLVVNAAANQFAERIVAINAALGDQHGAGTMVVNNRNSTTGRVVDAVGSGDGQIPILTLDEVATSRNIGRIDLLKIDVEGAELKVLRGGQATLRNTKRLVLEVNDRGSEWDVVRLLADVGFSSFSNVDAGPDSSSRARLVFASRTE